MFRQRSTFLLFGTFISLVFAAVGSAQTPLMKRTTSKTDKFDFGVGGTVAISGAPVGSIRIVGSSKNEIEITAEIEIQAASEADLARLGSVTTFVTQESNGRVGIITIGTHNKLGDKKLWSKFPKGLMNLPFRIDYTITVPRYCDLQIDNGKGDISVAGVEGPMRINSLASDAKLSLIGGGLTGTFGAGTVDISMPDRSWRGNAIDVQLVSGTMSVHLPANLSADLDALVLKTGTIENSFSSFKPRDRKVPFTDQAIISKVGTGGVSMRFAVSDGTLRLLPITVK